MFCLLGFQAKKRRLHFRPLKLSLLLDMISIMYLVAESVITASKSNALFLHVFCMAFEDYADTLVLAWLSKLWQSIYWLLSSFLWTCPYVFTKAWTRNTFFKHCTQMCDQYFSFQDWIKRECKVILLNIIPIVSRPLELIYKPLGPFLFYISYQQIVHMLKSYHAW